MSNLTPIRTGAQPIAKRPRSVSTASKPGKAPPPGWVRSTADHLKSLPVQNFPWKRKPDVFRAQSTVLRIEGARCAYTFLWCFLRRNTTRNVPLYDPTSLSKDRARAVAKALSRLSRWFIFKGIRPLSVEASLRHLGQFLNWADDANNEGRYAAALEDPEVALEALRAYHTHLRERLQGHRLSHFTAGTLDRRAIAMLSEIHGRAYSNDIEPLEAVHGQGTLAPEQSQVAQLLGILQAAFDSAARLVLNGTVPDHGDLPRLPKLLRLGSGLEDEVTLDDRYSWVKVAELACVAYAGLVFIDSGANLAVLQSYEEPEDLNDQLSEPNRINLTQKAVKFRAGGKSVEVHLSATTFTRIRTFLTVRQALVNAVQAADGGDIAPMFVQGFFPNHGSKYRNPATIGKLDKNFTTTLRRRFLALGVELPKVTLRQLRAYKQQDLVRRVPVSVAAKLMGHSVGTAIKAYCKSQEATRHGEITEYFSSLERTVLAAQGPKVIATTAIPVGACLNHGKPLVTERAASLPVQPDCSRPQGCFFCDNYRVHADEQDMKKLLSCRRILAPISALAQDSVSAHHVYEAVVDRINTLLAELERREPATYAAARFEVEQRGNLTPYFARKVSQLALLGMLKPPVPPSSDSR